MLPDRTEVSCPKQRTRILGATRTDTSTMARSADILGDGWNLLLIRQACLGIRGFKDFQQALGIGGILTARLDRLLEQGLLRRCVYQQRRTRHEYRLTDKGGIFSYPPGDGRLG